MHITAESLQSLEQALQGDPLLESVEAHRRVRKGIVLLEGKYTINGESKKGMGSGLLVTEEGFILTAYHIIASHLTSDSGSQGVEVVLPGGVRYPVDLSTCLVAEKMDICLVKAAIPGKPSPRKYKLRMDGQVTFGEEMILYGIDIGGTPELVGLSGRVRHCFEEGEGRGGNSFLTTNYSQGGFSGGSVVSSTGELLGIHTAHLTEKKLKEVHAVSTKITSIVAFYKTQFEKMK